jgi:hypothetical protein
MKSKIEVLKNVLGKEMPKYISKFYGFYSGDTSHESIETSLQTLTEFLKDFYDKEVIVLVDEHDSPVQSLYENISLDNPEDNIEVME